VRERERERETGDGRTKRGPMKARKEDAVSIERQKMKGRWTERTEGRTVSANSKGKSLTKRARGGVRKEREAEQEELEGLVG